MLCKNVRGPNFLKSAGVDGFTCPFWWNHWKVSLNLDWAQLEPVVKTALGKLTELRAAGGILQPAPKKAKAAADAHNRSLSGEESPPQLAAKKAGGGVTKVTKFTKSKAESVEFSGELTTAAAELLGQPGRAAANGVPLSSLACLHDDGKPEHRLCVASNVIAHEGKLYYVSGEWGGELGRGYLVFGGKISEHGSLRN